MGRPWKYRLWVADVFHNESFTLLEKAQVIASRVTASAFFDKEDGELPDIVDELIDAGHADDVAWFDQVWDAFYDYADAHRIWIETRCMDERPPQPRPGS